jgi:outer membrane protein
MKMFISIAFGIISFISTVFSQNSLKIGHVDINEIMASVPERDSTQIKLDKETKEIESTYEEMQVIFNKLVDDYQKGQFSLSDLISNTVYHDQNIFHSLLI